MRGPGSCVWQSFAVLLVLWRHSSHSEQRWSDTLQGQEEDNCWGFEDRLVENHLLALSPSRSHPWAVLIKEPVLRLGYRPGRLRKGCYFVPLHKKKKTQVTNFKTVMNSKLGEIDQISGGYWQVDDNPQKNLLWANSYSAGKRELLHPFTHRALPWERISCLACYYFYAPASFLWSQIKDWDPKIRLSSPWARLWVLFPVPTQGGNSCFRGRFPRGLCAALSHTGYLNNPCILRVHRPKTLQTQRGNTSKKL